MSAVAALSEGFRSEVRANLTLARACYPETQNEANVAVYRSVGFGIVSVGEVGGDLTVWAPRREPKGSRRPV